jgi:hypothetical protein
MARGRWRKLKHEGPRLGMVVFHFPPYHQQKKFIGEIAMVAA